jgi:hypothetical protein
MAIDYLRLIQIFAQATGNREILSAPAAAQKVQSIPIGESKTQAHFVYDVALTKQVLRNSDIYLQDHFLDKLLIDCDLEKVRWVKLFVEKSPEFLDGISHSATRKRFKANIDKYVAITSSKHSDDIKALVQRELNKESCSTLSVAKSIIRLRFTQILEEILENPISIADDLLFGPEIFTPSIRIKSSIFRLNDSTNQFILSYIPEAQQNDEAFILPILSLFYMASTPILASLAAFINCKIEQADSSNTNIFSDFKMIPTNYVAREASRDTDLDGINIRKGDKLYVMLFDSTGCPFSDGATLPFGHGKHLCPGADLSKLILRQSMQAAETITAAQWAQLRPASIQKGRGSAFLTYEA